MKILQRIVRIVELVSEWSGEGVAYLGIPVVLLIFGEVLLRYVFGKPTLWAGPTATYLWGAMCVLAGGYALKHGLHVNMDIIYNRFSPRGKAALDLFNSLFFFLACAALVWMGWKFGWYSVVTAERRGETWNPPIYPIKMTIFVGVCLLLLQGLVKLIRDIRLVVTRKELGRNK